MGWKIWTAWSTLVILAVGAASTGLVIYSFQQISNKGPSGAKGTIDAICDYAKSLDALPVTVGNDDVTISCIWKKSNSAVRIGTHMLGMIAAMLGVWGIVGGQQRASWWYLGLGVVVTVMSLVAMAFDSDAIRKGRVGCGDIEENVQSVECKSSLDPFIYTALYDAALFLAWGFSTYSAYKSYRARKDNTRTRLQDASGAAVDDVRRAAPPPPKPQKNEDNPFSI